jgi:hypothetical protein
MPFGTSNKKPIKSILMKANVKILTTCSLSTIFSKTTKNPFQKDF